MKNYQKMLLPVALLGVLACCKRNDVLATADGVPGSSTTRMFDKLSSAGDVIGKVTVGYQGWFSTPTDGGPITNGWGHTNLETYPDLRQYATTFSPQVFYQNGKSQPAFSGDLGNGSPARMYSSYTQQVSNVHCLWMQQNGIDCIALQRFGSYISNSALSNFYNGVASHINTAAQTYGRKFYIMYDCGAADSVKVKNDWTTAIAGSLALTSSPAYAKQNGKPVVCFFGVGKSDRGSPAGWASMINWFKAQGCYVIGSPLFNFASDVPGQVAYNVCDMIMPWEVGKRPGSNFQAIYTADLAYCNAHNIEYQADIYPGGAFFNTTNDPIRKNQIPRTHGDFMWSQFAGAKSAGVSSVYISMFDEMNEATNIMNSAEDSSYIPVGQYFLTLDAEGTHVSSDFYMRLVRDGSKMLKGQIPYVTAHPTPHVLTPPASLTPHVQSSSAIRINWSAVTNAPCYNIKRSTTNGGPYTTIAAELTSPTYTNTGLAANTTYYYIVTSGHINGGESIISRQVSSVTNP